MLKFTSFTICIGVILTLVCLPHSCGFVVPNSAKRSQTFETKISPAFPTEADEQPRTLAEYKEQSRRYRRTVFNFDDWKRHRESARHFRNLKTLFNSGVIRGMRNEVLAITAIAFGVVSYNLAIAPGYLGDLVGIEYQSELLRLPALPFTIGSSALGLLLVFRTNAAYSRWKDARIQWGGTINRSLDVCRAGLTYFGNKDGSENSEEIRELKKQLVFRTIAFARCLKGHFRDGEKEQVILREELTELFGPEEADRIMEAKHRPLRCVQDLSKVLRKGKMTDMQLQIVDKSVAFFCDSIGVCERIFKTPIPLIYTRHTSRSLSTWLLALPLALYQEKGTLFEHLAVIPEAALIAVFFYGIEELGVQIEEPFSILPMEAMGDAIERNCKELLFTELEESGVYDEGALCDSKWC